MVDLANHTKTGLHTHFAKLLVIVVSIFNHQGNVMPEHHHHFRRFARVTSIAILAVALAGCAKKPEVTGEVLDGFGKPLPKATVSVGNTTFVATTDGGGRYAVEYVPGKVIVTIAKEGYTSAGLALDIATEAKYPTQSVTLYKLPTEKGIVTFGASDYLPLPKGKLSVNSKEFPPSWSGPRFQETYMVTGDFAAINASTELAFLDNDGHNNPLYAVGAQGVILNDIRTSGERKIYAQILADNAVQIAPGVWLRRVTLAKGRYAFVAEEERAGLNVTPAIEPVYLFEVK